MALEKDDLLKFSNHYS